MAHKKDSPDQTPEQALRQLWEIFDRGDKLTDEELHCLLKSAEAGHQYLVSRGERLAAAKTALDMATIRNYLHYRKIF